MKNARDIIARRLSCRAFDGEPLSPQDEEHVQQIVATHTSPPFGSALRLQLLHTDDAMIYDISDRATYGNVRNPAQFVVAVVPRSRHSMEDFGYVLEHTLLRIEACGIATCWLGGTFNRGSFARQMQIDTEDLIPAVLPIGYPARRRTASDGSIRFSVGARKRKRWAELFYELEFWDDETRPQSAPTPLTPASAADAEAMLEAVRLAPSTSNQQPWRVYRYTSDSGPDLTHMFIARTAGFDKALKDVDMQKIDAGVAMAHYTVVAEELGFPGRWTDEKPPYLPRGVEYVATWRES